MITEISSKIKSSNKNAIIAFWSLSAFAVAVFAVYFIVDRYKGILGLLGIVLITMAVLIYTKYVGAEYYYDVTHDSDGYAVFVVRQIVGKRQSTLCRIGLSEITKVERESAEERRAHNTPVGCRKYVYTPTLFPAETYRIYMRNHYERAELIVEIPESWADMLRRFAATAREIEHSDDE